MGGVFVAWLLGESIVVYRIVKTTGAPPMPGQLAATAGLYAALALLAHNPKTRFFGQAGAWGFTAAAWLALYTNPPGGTKKPGGPPGKPVTATPTVSPAPTSNPVRQV